MVRDVLFGGLVKRVIGASSLKLEDFMEEDETGGWHPAKEVHIATEEEIQNEIADEDRQKKEAELATKLVEAQKKAEEDEKKRKEEEEAGGYQEPLLDEKETKVEVKDVGEGVGDLNEGKGEGNPLLGIAADPKKVKEEFKDNDSKFDKYDPEEDAKQADEPEEIPKYLRGRVVVDDELEDSMRMKPFHEIAISTGQKKCRPTSTKV